MASLIGVGIGLLIVGVFYWVIYNRLISAQNVCAAAFSDIDVHLKKRFELIPNLIEAVKGYNQHEADTLQKIVESRSNKSGIAGALEDDRSITSSLKTFRIHVEDYPDLKANTQFLKLMDNLSLIENELAMARRYYNGTVREFNITLQKFPNNKVGKAFGFKDAGFYKVEDNDDKVVPEVNFEV